MNGYIDNAPLGLICSRQYAEWMLSMNEKLDFPAESYYMLVRLFSRPQYQAFFDEENRKGNNFVYHLSETSDRLMLSTSMELVFLDYEECIEECTLVPLRKVIFGYRILQTRGCLPGDISSTFYESDVSYDNLITKICGRERSCLKLKRDSGWSDIYTRYEFQRAQSKGFIDNEWPYSVGPSCPDRLICYCSFYNIIETLINDIKKLGLIPKSADSYELKVLSVASEILTLAFKEWICPDTPFDKKEVLEEASAQFEKYSNSKSEKELSDTCRQIGEGLAVHVKVEIDTNNGAGMDCDFDDLKTAPVGLTNEDYERFSDMD